MHRAFEISEILLSIFGHCHIPGTDTGADSDSEIVTAGSHLPALARTCRAFKEPALDLLWKRLPNPSPIVRCLPEASHYKKIPRHKSKRYFFYRTLTPTEWDVLRSYIHRIQSLTDSGGDQDRLHWGSVKTFLSPSITSPLFPNLLYLRVVSNGRSKQLGYLLCMPFPSLRSLSIDAKNEKNLSVFQHSIELFSRFSQDINKLSFSSAYDALFSNLFTSRILRWQNLQAVSCIKVALDADALMHLSRLSALTELTFMVSAALPNQITPSYIPLRFPNVRVLIFNSDVLESISCLLSRMRLRAAKIFAVIIGGCPSKMDLSSFQSALHASGIADSVEELHMNQVSSSWYTDGTEDRKLILTLEDLRPFMVVSNLRHFSINIGWNVELSNEHLLALTSSWPRLELLHINDDWTWSMEGGITPDGLLQLLQQCPSLRRIAIAVDTRNVVVVPPSLENGQGLTWPPKLSICVIDSALEQESVQPIAAFFAGIASHTSLSFSTRQPNWMTNFRWTQVEMHLEDGTLECRTWHAPFGTISD